MIEKLVLAYIAFSIVAVSLGYAYDAHKARAYRKKMLSFCMRDADGHIFITDPQTGTAHRFDEILTKRLAGETAATSPRQRKRATRKVRQRIAAQLGEAR